MPRPVFASVVRSATGRSFTVLSAVLAVCPFTGSEHDTPGLCGG
jgi:hypothetical protein